MHEPAPDDADPLAEQVGRDARRKLRARRGGSGPVWFGLGAMGIIGWSVVVPTVAGAALGLWLDARPGGDHAWTLSLMVAGLVLGCANAWHWVSQQDRAMHEQERNGDDANG